MGHYYRTIHTHDGHFSQEPALGFISRLFYYTQANTDANSTGKGAQWGGDDESEERGTNGETARRQDDGSERRGTRGGRRG